MKKRQLRITSRRFGLGMLVSALLLLAGCSKEEEAGDTLPEGKYPMTFTATVDGLTVEKAATRAGKDTWTEGDLVAISTDKASTSKTYKITDASTGEMQPNAEDEVLYWQCSKSQSIRAWYPATAVTNADISNQSGGYASFDYLTSDGTYDFASSVSLTFNHQMAKVKCTLSIGEGITEENLSSATVKIYGYTKANFTNGTLTGTDNGWITPLSGTISEALVVPQQMQGKQFIKVTVGTGVAARDYYYTPTNSNDANLQAGKQHNYTITVKKTGLVVAPSSSVSWGDESSITGGPPSVVPNYKITLPASDSGSPLSSITVTKADGSTITGTDGTYFLPVSETSFKVSYSTTNCMKSLVIASGLCRMSRNYDSNNASNYTCTYSNVVSDITLAVGDYAEPGDYYYSDGTWSPAATAQTTTAGTSSPVAIGVVFHSGAGTNDDISYYDGKPIGKIHGYVVAAKDLTGAGYDGKTSYGGRLPKGSSGWLQNFDVPEIANGDNNSYNGFSVMKIIRTYMAKTTEYEFPAFALCDTYGTVQAAPNSSSGWYLPSAAMLRAINNIKDKLTNCPGGSKPNNDYMSCTENDARGVQGFAFHINEYTGRSKNDNNTKARAVLTF